MEEKRKMLTIEDLKKAQELFNKQEIKSHSPDWYRAVHYYDDLIIVGSGFYPISHIEKTLTHFERMGMPVKKETATKIYDFLLAIRAAGCVDVNISDLTDLLIPPPYMDLNLLDIKKPKPGVFTPLKAFIPDFKKPIDAVAKKRKF